MVVIADAEVCHVGGSSSVRSNQGDHHWSWSQTGPDACKCTKIVTSEGHDITSSTGVILRDLMKCGTYLNCITGQGVKRSVSGRRPVMSVAYGLL